MTERFRVNGREVELAAEPGDTLMETLRRGGYTEVKIGCGEGDCGACTVLLDGEPVNSCLVLAARVDGRAVTTIEGLGTVLDPNPLQQAFVEAGAVQCGYCTPGMILAAKALLDAEPDPAEARSPRRLAGNLCRCTGYVKNRGRGPRGRRPDGRGPGGP